MQKYMIASHKFQCHKSLMRVSRDPFPILEGGFRQHQTNRYLHVPAVLLWVNMARSTQQYHVLCSSREDSTDTCVCLGLANWGCGYHHKEENIVIRFSV